MKKDGRIVMILFFALSLTGILGFLAGRDYAYKNGLKLESDVIRDAASYRIIARQATEESPAYAKSAMVIFRFCEAKLKSSPAGTSFNAVNDNNTGLQCIKLK